jgi:hypothetical protein
MLESGKPWRAALLVALALALIGGAVSGFLYLYFLQRQEYLIALRFRTLARAAEKLKTRVETMANQVIPNAVSAAQSSPKAGQEIPLDQKITDYLKLVPSVSFEPPAVQKFPPPQKPGAGAAQVILAPSESGTILRIIYSVRSGTNEQVVVEVAGNAALAELWGVEPEPVFDALLLTDRCGIVTYAQGAQGLQFVRLDRGLEPVLREKVALTKEEGEPEKPPGKGESKMAAAPTGERAVSTSVTARTFGALTCPSPEWETARFATSLSRASFGGQQYLVFLQPVLVALRQPGGGEERVQAERWHVAGMLREEELNRESRQISYTLLLILVFVILLVALSWPFLKLLLLGERDRLSRRDALVVCFSGLLTVSFVTLFLQDIATYYWAEEALDRQLEKMALEIDGNFRAELRASLRALKELNKMAAAKEDAVRTHLLQDAGVRELWQQGSFFRHAAWSDAQGQQKKKWTISSQAAPLVTVAGREYFRRARDAQLWELEGNRFWLELVESMSTGESVLVLATEFPAAAEGGAAVSALDLEPVSLRRPVLPPGFGFAVLDETGRVLFHSDAAHHAGENFFEESDNNLSLQASVRGRVREETSAEYHGQSHRMYVYPMMSPPWTLVTFREKLPLRTHRLETVSMALALFFAYAILLLVPLRVVWFWKPDWLWPDEERLASYGPFFAGSLMAGLGMVAGHMTLVASQQVFAAIFFPLLLVAATYTTFERQGAEGEGPVRKRMPPERAVRLALTNLPVLLVLGVLAYWSIPAGGALPLLILLTWGALAVWVMHSESVRNPLEAWRKGGSAWLRALLARDLRLSIVLSATTILLLTGVLPMMIFFRVALTAEVGIYRKHLQAELYRGLERRAAELSLAGQKLLAAYPQQPEDNVKSAWQERMKSKLDVVQGFLNKGLGFNCPEPADRAEPLKESQFTKFMESIRPLYNRYASQTDERIHVRTDDDQMRWSLVEAGTPVPCLRLEAAVLPSGTPGVTSLASPTFLGPQHPAVVLLILLSAGAIVVVAWKLARVMNARLFLLEHVREPEMRAAEEEAERGTGRKQKLVLFISGGKGSPLPDATGGARLECAQRAWRDQALAQIRKRQAAAQKVVLCGLEATLDPGESRRNRETLEALIRAGFSILAVCERDPLESRAFFAPAGEEEPNEYAREAGEWAAVWNLFTVINAEQYGFEDAVRFAGVVFAGWKEYPAGEQFHRKVLEACDNSPYVMSLVFPFVRDLKEARLDERAATELVLRHATRFYRGTWNGLTRIEKLALYDLAQDGFINAVNPSIRALLGRGLLVWKPNLRLMNLSLRQFVLAEGKRERLFEWAQAGKSNWQLTKWPLLAAMLGVLVLVFYTRRDLFESGIGMLSAVGGLLTALFKLFDVVQEKRRAA